MEFVLYGHDSTKFVLMSESLSYFCTSGCLKWEEGLRFGLLEVRGKMIRVPHSGYIGGARVGGVRRVC